MTEELENLENKSSWGGPRPNSGRPLGSENKATKEKKAAEEEFKQRILRSIDKLFNAQINIAQGESYVFKIVDTGEGKDKKREHVLVENPEEIKEVLDETDGMGGTVDGTYYYITTKRPDNKAIDSMIDRVFGKANQNVNIDGKLTNYNLNADVECSPEEHEAVKQAILKSVENPGSQE